MKPIMYLFLIMTGVSAFNPQPTRYIAHAGGGVDGVMYSNSLEALDYNYKLGHQIFEMDFDWTSDRKLIALHDWEDKFEYLFGFSVNSPLDYETVSRMKMIENLTVVTLPMLTNWLQRHPYTFIVTDMKVENLLSLKYLAENCSRFIFRFIPQIYETSEYEKVKELGFDNIILTLYLNKQIPEEIEEFVRNNKLFAAAMPVGKKDFDEYLRIFKENGVFVYVHTYNDPDIAAELLNTPIDGIYTDFLH